MSSDVPFVSAFTFMYEGDVVKVFMSDYVDTDSEFNKKELARVAKRISGHQKRLSKAGFVTKAPEKIVERERRALSILLARQSSLELLLEGVQ